MQVKIKEDSWFAALAAKKMKAKQLAIVYNKTIHLYQTTTTDFMADTRWLCHELQHVKQYQKEGSFIFLCKYIWYWMQVGYYNIPYEKDARDNELNLELLKEFEVKV